MRPFWRVMIPVIAGYFFWLGGCIAIVLAGMKFDMEFGPIAGLMFAMHLLAVIAAMLLFEGLTPDKTKDAGETCCRKCSYILRGLSEPRCPECGEKI